MSVTAEDSIGEAELRRVSTAERAEEDYFSRNPAPKEIEHVSTLAKAFVKKHQHEGRRIALITSGGTTVPLENQTVRFIDNFSAGTRGATSAEYFLEHDYAVIFLHRKFSLLPFSRHYSHSTNCFLDFMSLDKQGRVYVKDEYQDDMQRVLARYQDAKDKGKLMLLPFTTITEYLWSLRDTAFALQPMGRSAVFYLAAAVSDFFIPKDRISEHKIQSSNPQPDLQAKGGQSSTASGGNKLVIDLDPVPKFLKRLVDGWAPHAMIVSFKLETDPSILIFKARGALEKYSHHLVIGNLLATRSYEVVLVDAKQETWIRVPTMSDTPRTEDTSGTLPSPSTVAPAQERRNDKVQSTEIESLIIPDVIKLHKTIIGKDVC